MTRKVHWLKFLIGLALGLSGANVLKNLMLYNVEPLCSHKSNLERKVSIKSTISSSWPSRSQNVSRKLLLVGVMTAQKYLDTRAVAIYETWGKKVPGDIIFFSSESSQSDRGLPLVALKGVDDSYPPQKKSFLMMKFIHDNYLNNYEWFMRADDDVYVRTDRLEHLLRAVDSSKPQFIGQAGVGNKEEFGQLNLDTDENFCMGGPGMLFSRETLHLTAPHVKYCLKHLYSTHEDVEVGRCVRKYTGIPCTWSYQMQSIFYHNFTGETATSPRLKTKEIHRAITLHPIKITANMHRLHDYYHGLQLEDYRYKTLLLHRELKEVSKRLKEDPDDGMEKFCILANSSLLGLKPDLNKFVPSFNQEIASWDFFTKSIYSVSSVNPQMRLNSAFQMSLNDIVLEVMESINKFSKQRGRVIEFKDLFYGYYRVNPLYGADYILDLFLTYKKYIGKKMTLPVRRHAYLQRTFTTAKINRSNRKYLESALHKVVHFVVPLSGRTNTFERFLINFENVCLTKNEAVKLAVVFFAEKETSSTSRVSDLMSGLRLKYPGYDLRLVETSGAFSRALALEIGAKLFSVDSLLFFIDVDMIFDESVLQRVRLNTVLEKKVYFPVVFSQYDPEYVKSSLPDGSPIVRKDFGFWRLFGYGIVSLYHADLQSVGGMDTSIQGWGKEDVDLFSKVVESNLEIFRAPDPGLIHIFHPIMCDTNLELSQFEMCLGSKSSSMGTAENLAKTILKEYRMYFN